MFENDTSDSNFPAVKPPAINPIRLAKRFGKGFFIVWVLSGLFGMGVVAYVLYLLTQLVQKL